MTETSDSSSSDLVVRIGGKRKKRKKKKEEENMKTVQEVEYVLTSDEEVEREESDNLLDKWIRKSSESDDDSSKMDFKKLKKFSSNTKFALGTDQFDNTTGSLVETKVDKPSIEDHKRIDFPLPFKKKTKPGKTVEDVRKFNKTGEDDAISDEERKGSAISTMFSSLLKEKSYTSIRKKGYVSRRGLTVRRGAGGSVLIELEPEQKPPMQLSRNSKEECGDDEYSMEGDITRGEVEKGREGKSVLRIKPAKEGEIRIEVENNPDLLIREENSDSGNKIVLDILPRDGSSPTSLELENNKPDTPVYFMGSSKDKLKDIGKWRTPSVEFEEPPSKIYTSDEEEREEEEDRALRRKYNRLRKKKKDEMKKATKSKPEETSVLTSSDSSTFCKFQLVGKEKSGSLMISLDPVMENFVADCLTTLKKLQKQKVPTEPDKEDIEEEEEEVFHFRASSEQIRAASDSAKETITAFCKNLVCFCKNDSGTKNSTKKKRKKDRDEN